MSLNFCDLLVLGSDLSGVMAATLLAKRGMNVLVLDDDSEQNPHPNIITGLGSRTFKSLLGKLMIADSKLQIVQENKVACQVVFPKNRLDLYRQRPLFLKEIDREFPEDRAALEEMLGEVDRLRESYLEEFLSYFPIVSPKEKKRFVRWVAEFPDQKIKELWECLSPSVQCLLKAQIGFLAQGPLLEPPLLQMMLFLPPDHAVSYSVRGGSREIKKIFFDKLEYFGGMVHPLDTSDFQVISKRKEIKGIQLPQFNFPTRCRVLLGNTNIQRLYQALPASFLDFSLGRTKRKIASWQPLEKWFLVQYRVPREILPSPMKENLLLIQDPTAPLEGSNYLSLNLESLSKPAPDGTDTILTVSFRMNPAKILSNGTDFSFLEPVYEEIDQNLQKLLPFSKPYLKKIFPPSQTPFEGENVELFPEEQDANRIRKRTLHRISYAPSFHQPSLTSDFSNLFVLGPNMLDWIGLEGKTNAALKAVEMIWENEQKARNS